MENKLNDIQFLKSIQTIIATRIEILESTKNIFNMIRLLFKDYYVAKAKEITGRDVKIPWAAKEARLLNADIKQYGEDELKRMLWIFFSDKDVSVANFTRYKTKAGYGYSVFHGVISNLILSNAKIEKPCIYCGKIGKHSFDCEISIRNREEKRKEQEEIEKFRNENPDFSIMDNFKENIKGAKNG